MNARACVPPIPPMQLIPTMWHTWPFGGARASRSKRSTAELCNVLKRTRTDEPLHVLYHGAGATLLSLLRTTAKLSKAKHIPALLDETVCHLYDNDDAVCSLPWNGTAPAHRLPRLVDATDLAFLVMSRLDMGSHEVVTAMVLLELLVQTRGALFCPRSARPIFLACCILACQLTVDTNITTTECFDAVSEGFTNTTPLLFARIQEQLLVLLDWRIPNAPELYTKQAHALAEAGVPRKSKQTTVLVPVLY